MRARIYAGIAAGVGLLVAAGGAEAQHHDRHEHDDHQVVHVTGEDYAFRVPAEIPSGWTTFRFENAGQETHMMFISRLPDGVTFDDYMTDAAVPFNEAWYALRDGRIGSEEVFPLIIDNLEPWYWNMQYTGGVGMIAPGRVAEATLNLEPGNYVIECYMRTPEGEVHYMEGMIDPLVVTEARSPGSAPQGDVRITLSEAGMQVDRELPAGTHTFEVLVVDHPENTFGHNVHVIRLDDGAAADEVLGWLDFASVRGLVDPAPGVFVGGITPIPAGTTGYFRTTLVPGRYLLVSEFTGHLGIHREIVAR